MGSDAGSDADTEEGIESGDEVSDSEEAPETVGPLAAGLGRAPTGSSASAGTAVGAIEAEQLLFTFEDERGSSSPTRASPFKPPLAGPRSVIVLPSSPDGAASNGHRTSLDGPPESPFATLAAFGGLHPPVGGMAKSLCPPAGFSSAHHARRARRRSHSQAATKGHSKASKYPPPVRATSPDATSALFEGLEDKDDWKLFITFLEEEIDDALAGGVWRASGTGQQQQMGMSCPKF